MAGKFQAELKVDVSQAITGVEKLDKKIDGVVEKQKTLRDLKATANVNVDVNDSDIAELKKDIAAVDGKNVDVNVNVKQPSGGLTAFTAGIGAAVGGAALTGVTALAEGLLEGAQAADAFGDTLSIAFTQQGIADVEGEIESVKQSTLSLAQELGLPIARVRELGQAVATIGGLSGEQAEGLTKLSVSIETFTDGTVKGEAIVKAFSRGIADPEGAAAIDALSKKYPQLSDTLRSTASASEKLAEANKILGPSFAAAVAGANDVGGVIQRVKNTVSEGFENVGTKIAAAILPAITFLLDNAELLLPIVIGLAAGLVVYAASAAAAAIATAYASVAGLTFNAVLAANPVAAITLAVIALTAGVMLLADALEETAEEQLAVTETQIAATKSQIEDNEAKKKGAISTQAMVKEYKELANKTALTAKEQERMRGIQNELDKQYPDLIDQTKSFRDNLDGVEAAGKAVTTSMEGLTKEGIKLGEQLKEQTKLLAFVKRNAEIQKLENVFGFFDGQGFDAQRTKAVGLAKAAIEKFKSEILASQNESQVLDAQRAINEVLNKNAGQLAGEYEELTRSVQSSISAQIAAINLAKGIKPIGVTEVKPVEKIKDRSKDEKAGDAFKEATAAVEKFKQAQQAALAIQLDLIDAEVASGKLTKENAAIKIATLKNAELQLVFDKAKEIFKAVIGDDGFTIKTKIKGTDKVEAVTYVNALQLELNKALRAVAPLKIKAAPVVDVGLQKTANERLLDAWQRDQEKKRSLKIKIDFDVNKTFEGLQKDILAIDFEEIFKPVNDGAEEAIAGISEKFRAGAISYQSALKDIADSTKPAVDRLALVFDSLAKNINASTEASVETFAELGRKRKEILGDASLSDAEREKQLQAQGATASDVADAQSEALASVAVSAGATFASLIANGESFGTALLKTALQTAQSMLAIFAPQILGAFSIAIPGPVGFIAGGAAVATLSALLAVAAAGFKDGGPTGDNIGSNQVAGVVHGKEFVAPERMYAKHGDLLKHLYANRELSSFPEIQSLMKQNQIIPMRDLALNMGGGSQSITVNAMAGDALKPLQDELQGVRRQLVAMEALHKSSSDITVTADEGYHARRARRSAIKGARN